MSEGYREPFGGKYYGIWNVEGEGEPVALFGARVDADRELSRRQALSPDDDERLTVYHQVFPCDIVGAWWNSYAGRKAEAAAIADARRLPEWVLLAEIARRRQGRAALDDAALAERLWLAARRPGWPPAPGYTFAGMDAARRAEWLRVAAEARAALLPPPVLDAPERWTDDVGHVWPWRIGKAVRVGYRYVCERCGKGWGSVAMSCPGSVIGPGATDDTDIDAPDVDINSREDAAHIAGAPVAWSHRPRRQ